MNVSSAAPAAAQPADTAQTADSWGQDLGVHVALNMSQSDVGKMQLCNLIHHLWCLKEKYHSLLFLFDDRRVFYTRFYFEQILNILQFSMSSILFRHVIIYVMNKATKNGQKSNRKGKEEFGLWALSKILQATQTRT